MTERPSQSPLGRYLDSKTHDLLHMHPEIRKLPWAASFLSSICLPNTEEKTKQNKIRKLHYKHNKVSV